MFRPFKSCSSGYSVLEIMIVVVLIGLLSTMGVVAYQQHRSKVLATAFAASLRQHCGAVETCIFDTKNVQLGAPPGQLAPVLAPYIRQGNWGARTPLGGKWVVDTQLDGTRISVGVDGIAVKLETVELVDRLMDDGNLSSGRMRLVNPSKLIFALE